MGPMSSSWQGYADLDSHQPGYVRVTLGQFSPTEAVLAEFPTPILRRVERQEATQTTSAQPLELPIELAEALHKALDRIFGNHHEEGVKDVLTEALNHERARVDLVLSRVPIVITSQPVATDTVG